MVWVPLYLRPERCVLPAMILSDLLPWMVSG